MRVATFNIRHGRPEGRRHVDLTAMAAAVAGLRADVLALQEVDVGVPRSGRADLALLAAEAVPGRTFHFAPAAEVDGGRYGNALVVRGRILDAVDHPLPGVGEPRVATVATVAVPDEQDEERTLTVGLCHLSPPRRGSADQTVTQLRSVLDLLDAAPFPQVLLGDLNLDREPAEPLLRERGWDAAIGAPTFPALRPRLHIDWVAVRGRLHIESVVVPALSVSDHRPLVTSLVERGAVPYPPNGQVDAGDR